MSLSKEALDTLIDTAVVANGGLSLDTSTPAILIPDGYKIENIEHLHARPARFRGVYRTSVIADFASYVKQHAAEESAGFVEPEDMVARVLFDLGNAQNPGHGQHSAALQLKPTTEYAALNQARSSVFTQRELIDWLADWADNITVQSDDGGEYSIAQAIKAISKMSVSSRSEHGSEISAVGAKRSVMEEIEAKSQGAIPSGFIFTCVPYVGLYAIAASLRLSVLPGGDTLKFRLRWMRREAQEQTIAEDFIKTLSDKLGDTVSLLIGKFI